MHPLRAHSAPNFSDVASPFGLGITLPFSPSPLPPHPWPLPAGELHPSLLYGFSDSCHGLRLADGFAPLDSVNGVEMNLGLLAKVPNAPIEKAPCRSYLRACHHVHVILARGDRPSRVVILSQRHYTSAIRLNLRR